MLVAITRKVSPNIGRCELTHLTRRAIDIAVASEQHRRYEACLASLGCEIRSLPAEADLPDSVFVEDMAVVLDELAIIARPGAESRRPEAQSVADAIRPYRDLFFVKPPGTIDGGDVLRLDRTLYVGSSRRTNSAGIEQVRAAVAAHGYNVRVVGVGDCLHLKSAVTQVARDALLINRAWVDADAFEGTRFIDVDPDEPLGANALLVESTVVYPSAYERTRKRMEENGIGVVTVDVSELAKAEGGVTCCCSLISGA